MEGVLPLGFRSRSTSGSGGTGARRTERLSSAVPASRARPGGQERASPRRRSDLRCDGARRTAITRRSGCSSSAIRAGSTGSRAGSCAIRSARATPCRRGSSRPMGRSRASKGAPASTPGCIGSCFNQCIDMKRRDRSAAPRGVGRRDRARRGPGRRCGAAAAADRARGPGRCLPPRRSCGSRSPQAIDPLPEDARRTLLCARSTASPTRRSRRRCAFRRER